MFSANTALGLYGLIDISVLAHWFSGHSEAYNNDISDHPLLNTLAVHTYLSCLKQVQKLSKIII